MPAGKGCSFQGTLVTPGHDKKLPATTKTSKLSLRSCVAPESFCTRLKDFSRSKQSFGGNTCGYETCSAYSLHQGNG